MRQFPSGFGLAFASGCALAFVLACGGQESSPPEGGAGAAGAAAEETPDVGAAREAMAEVHPSVERCLDLVRAGDFEAALPSCMEAVGVDPDNEEVQQALDDAKAGAAEAQAGEAAGEAKSRLEEAAGDLGERMP